MACYLGCSVLYEHFVHVTRHENVGAAVILGESMRPADSRESLLGNVFRGLV